MECIKKERRTIKDLLKCYSCEACKYYITDEVIRVGNKNINLLKLKEGCKKDLNNINIKKLKIFLKDMILNNDTVTFLWLTEKELNIIFSYLPVLLDFNKELYIIY